MLSLQHWFLQDWALLFNKQGAGGWTGDFVGRKIFRHSLGRGSVIVLAVIYLTSLILMTGMRPIVEFQIPSLVYVAFDQLVNQAAKMRLMLGGQASVPVTYLVMAAGTRPGSWRSRSRWPSR